MAGETQRIARLTPLGEVLARINALVRSVQTREMNAADVIGRKSVAEWRVRPRPGATIALRDGWAVASELTSDASGYAPVPVPAATRIDVGEPLPAGSDAIASLDVIVVRDGVAEVTAPVHPGEGVLPMGADADWRNWFRWGGKVHRAIDAAVLVAAGMPATDMCVPRVHIVRARDRRDAILEAAGVFTAAAVASAGGEVHKQSAGDLAAALADTEADAVIGIGGTGVGRNDDSVRVLAAAGRVEVHGVALSPGETAAFGMVGSRPVLLVPGRLDAAIAIWLTLGRHLLGRLSGATEEPAATPAVLTRKHASPLGLTEVVPVRAAGGKAEPIASGYWPLQAIAQADGWVLVPADSEGYPAGAEVMVRPWA